MTFTATPTSEFIAHPLLRDAHVMTIAPVFIKRKLEDVAAKATERLFQVDDDSQIIAKCHWQDNPTTHPTIVLLHGLEGSADSHYMLAIAKKAEKYSFNCVRINLRNCGETMHLTPTLYNAGLSKDIIRVAETLHKEGHKQIILAGCSLGGNIVLKAAGEMAAANKSYITGVAAISPSIDLERAVQAIEHPANRVYELWFLRTLKAKIRAKHRLFPDRYNLRLLERVAGIRSFDDCYTAPDGGYGTAANYYATASAMNFIGDINVPALIIAAQDDPLVPFASFEEANISNRHIRLLATAHGGHAGFIQKHPENNHLYDRFWAENRVVSFCQEVVYGLREDS